MRTFLVLICSLALACAAGGAQKEDKSKKQAPKKKQVQSSQHAGVTPGGHADLMGTSQAAQHAGAPGGGPQKVKGSQHGTTAHHASGSYSARVGSTAGYQKKTKGSQHMTTKGDAAEKTKGKAKGSQQSTANAAPPSFTDKPFGVTKQKLYRPQNFKTEMGGVQANKHKFEVKQFKLGNTPKTQVAAVKFKAGAGIQGAQNWHGANYAAFRNYKSEWHDEGWWHNHYGNNIVFMFGAPYFLNAGYWFPAWGYTPNAYYAWDGPIPAYNNLPPDQVIANVQSALQQQGYYHGDIDGLIGPETRGALAAYQRDHGLYETATIDQPTLESLGMT